MSADLQWKIQVQVRYVECDPMNVAHHSVYPVWMEMARTDMLKGRGISYSDLEKSGVFFVVARLSIRYKRPAYYDEQLTIHVTQKPTAGVKLEHEYEIYRGEQLLADAQTTLACVDRQGKLQPIPPMLLTKPA